MREDILKSREGVRLIQGEPGVGKTWFGCELAQYELNNPSLGGVGRGQKILFVTFARNAVARIRQVFLNQISTDKKKKEEFIKRVRIETFAGFFWWLVEAYGRYAKGGTLKRLWLIGSRKVLNIAIPSGYIGCTFDELEEMALRLVNIRAVRKLLSEIYPLVIVDEFQDVHERLFEIIAALGQESRVVLLRGPGQCIYRNLKQFDPEEILEKCRKKLNPGEYTLPVSGQGEKQRFCREISDFVNIYKKGEQLPSLQTWPIKLKSVPKVNTRGNPNQLETFAALELQNMRGYLNKHTSTIAVLANTNLAVSKIHRRVKEGSTSYRLDAQSNSLFFGDNILLQYGRLMLRLLQTHWVVKGQKHVSTEEVAALLAMLFQEHDTHGNYPTELLMGLAELLIDKAKRQHAPRDGFNWECCLTNNLSKLNRWLRATQQELRRKGISNCPSTAFDERDNALLETLAREFILSIKGSVNKAGRLNIEKATRNFEKTNQQKVIFEKLGLQKNVQVMTIHKSKSREFNGVVLVLEDNYRAVWRKNGPGSDEEVEDLYRVAITRASSAFALVAFEDARKEARDVVKKLLPKELWREC